MTFLKVWIGYTLFGVLVFSAMFLWAVRSRQFSDMDRARRIAIRSIGQSEDEKLPTPSRIDRYTWVVVLSVAIAAMAMVLWVGIRG